MIKKLKAASHVVRKRLKTASKKPLRFINAKPFASFFMVLGILVALIVASNILGAPKKEEAKTVTPVKQTHIYRIGKSPKLTVQGQIRKSGVIRITALTGGVVQRIYKDEGDTFYKGQTLIGISSNYQGGNLASLQRRLQQVQKDNIDQTDPLQRDLIQKQRDLANEVNDVAGETDLSDLQESVTNKQLDITSKSLDLSKESAAIQLQIAQVTEASMFPSAPFAGAVDKVFVKIGQQVTPGMDLMQISEDIKADPVTAIAYVSADVAKKISRTEYSTIHIGGENLQALPFYVSENAVQGLLYAVYFDIPESYRGEVTEKGFVQIEIPLGESDTSALTPFIPIDSIYQTKDTNYVFIVKDKKAYSKKVELGEVFGSFVRVKSGLLDGDEVITDRNVIAGDPVEIVN